jgi:hypothetical protein
VVNLGLGDKVEAVKTCEAIKGIDFSKLKDLPQRIAAYEQPQFATYLRNNYNSEQQRMDATSRIYIRPPVTVTSIPDYNKISDECKHRADAQVHYPFGTTRMSRSAEHLADENYKRRKADFISSCISSRLSENQTSKGNCDCPYDIARDGSICGRRRAYSRSGGRSPICYPSDVGH